MIQMLNKFAVFIVIGCIGYLTYSSLSGAASKTAAEGKELPVVTKKMLNPVYVEPQKHASPIERDPFDVDWDRYITLAASEEKENTAGPVADGNNIRFPDELMGIITGTDGKQLALIGKEVYGIGAMIKQTDSNRVWQVTAIRNESVVLTCNGQQTVLKILDGGANYVQKNTQKNVQKDVQKDNSKDQKQKESTK